MNISCTSQSFDRLFVNKQMDLISFIDFASTELGITSVEIEDKHFENTTEEYLKKVKHKLESKKMFVSDIAFFCSFGYPTKKENDAELERAYKFMNVAKTLDSANFRIFAGWMGGGDPGIHKDGGPRQKPEEAWNNMIQYVIQVSKTAKEKNLNVVLENHNHGGFLSCSKDALRLFEETKVCDNLSLLLDTGNYVDGIDGIKSTVYLAKHHIHLKANTITDDGHDTEYDFDAIIDVIKKSGYNKTISIEYEGMQDERIYVKKIVDYIKKIV